MYITFITHLNSEAKFSLELLNLETSLEIQWLGFWTSAAGGVDSIPGQGTKIPHAMRHGKKNRKEKEEKYLISV